MAKVDCFERYVTFMIRSRGREKRAAALPSSVAQMCAEHQDKLSCYDSYLKLWMKSVRAGKTKSKTSNVASEQRNAGNGFESAARHQDEPFESQFRAPSEYRFASWPQVPFRVGKRGWNICPPGMDPIDCFDQYVAMYARRTHRNRRLVGRQAPGGLLARDDGNQVAVRKDKGTEKRDVTSCKKGDTSCLVDFFTSLSHKP